MDIHVEELALRQCRFHDRSRAWDTRCSAVPRSYRLCVRYENWRQRDPVAATRAGI